MTRGGQAPPTRTCIGCGTPRPSHELFRVAVRTDGALAVGRSLPGRGAWICRATAEACASRARRRGRWSSALRSDVADAAVEGLIADIERSQASRPLPAEQPLAGKLGKLVGRAAVTHPLPDVRG